jgi:hypothetical protein
VEPLPFHGMTTNPYRAPDHNPAGPQYHPYPAEYNTRAGVRRVPMLDTQTNRSR